MVIQFANDSVSESDQKVSEIWALTFDMFQRVVDLEYHFSYFIQLTKPAWMISLQQFWFKLLIFSPLNSYVNL